jgi:hypothetical protein
MISYKSEIWVFRDLCESDSPGKGINKDFKLRGPALAGMRKENPVSQGGG